MRTVRECLVERPIVVGERVCKKGISMHGGTTMTWNLPEGYTRLKAVTALDPSVPGGDVRVRIFGDGRVLWEKSVTQASEPIQLDLDVTNVGRLAIEADFGKGLDLGDHLNLGNLRIVK